MFHVSPRVCFHACCCICRLPRHSPPISASLPFIHLPISQIEYASEFRDHPDIQLLHNVDDKFMATFKSGFEAYKGGRWEEARGHLEAAVTGRLHRMGAPQIPDGAVKKEREREREILEKSVGRRLAWESEGLISYSLSAALIAAP